MISAEDFSLPLADLERLVVTRDERRVSPRFSFLVPLLIVPQSDTATAHGRFPQTVFGRDISAGGISFFCNGAPAFERLEIELRQGDVYCRLAALVVGSRSIGKLHPYHVVHCKFLGMVP